MGGRVMQEGDSGGSIAHALEGGIAGIIQGGIGTEVTMVGRGQANHGDLRMSALIGVEDLYTKAAQEVPWLAITLRPEKSFVAGRRDQQEGFVPKLRRESLVAFDE